jgi:integrase
MKLPARGWGSVRPYRGGKFRVRITIDGERIEQIVPTQDIAKATLAALQQRKVEVKAGIAHPRGMAEHVRVKDVIPELLDMMRAGTRHVYSDTTLRTYGIECQRIAQAPIGSRRIASLRQRDVDAYASTEREAGAGTSHVRHLLDRLAQILRHAHEAGYISKIPVQIKRPKYIRNTATWCPSELELGRLVAAARDAYDKRALAAVLIGADAGLRLTEIGQLRVRDVDLENGVFHVESRGERKDRTKTAERRIVPVLTTRVRKAVEALMAGRSAEQPIFGVTDKEAVSGCAAPAWRKGLGFEPRWHGLRRRFATWQALRGTPVPIIQAWLGHSSITTTMAYIRIPEEALRRGALSKRRTGAKSR